MKHSKIKTRVKKIGAAKKVLFFENGRPLMFYRKAGGNYKLAGAHIFDSVKKIGSKTVGDLEHPTALVNKLTHNKQQDLVNGMKKLEEKVIEETTSGETSKADKKKRLREISEALTNYKPPHKIESEENKKSLGVVKAPKRPELNEFLKRRKVIKSD